MHVLLIVTIFVPLAGALMRNTLSNGRSFFIGYVLLARSRFRGNSREERRVVNICCFTGRCGLSAKVYTSTALIANLASQSGPCAPF